MSSLAPRIRTSLTFLHRWLGAGFCGLFALWFGSGFVMMYWTFPRIDPAERMARLAAIEPGSVRISPEQAFARVDTSHGAPNRVVITMLDSRPVYRIINGTHQTVVFGDSGDLLTSVPVDMGRRVASAWVRQPAASTQFQGILREADQWTVNGVFRVHGSLLKYAWPDGQEAYVSPLTGEVVQHTTRGLRIGAYLGAIPHWLYFAPLRRHRELWSTVVTWSSGLATVVSILGLVIGFWKYSPLKRYRTRNGFASLPYVGQKRWHVIFGLLFGLFACTWAFSGMMSMEPFPGIIQPGTDVRRFAEALRPARVPVGAFAEKHPNEALAQVKDLKVKELELLLFADGAAYLAVQAPGISSVVTIHGSPKRGFDKNRLVDVMADASRPYGIGAVRVVTEYETYYLDRHRRLPLPALLIELNNPAHSMYYIDPRTARIVESLTASSRLNRWLYHGLHSMNLPWLYRHRPLWDVLVAALLTGGAALCFTSLVISWRLLRAMLN